MSPSAFDLDQLVELLKQAIEQRENRKDLIQEFQRIVWDAHVGVANESILDVLSDLACDFDYYEPNAEHRAEDASYIDDARVVALIEEGFNSLRKLGIRNAGL